MNDRAGGVILLGGAGLLGWAWLTGRMAGFIDSVRHALRGTSSSTIPSSPGASGASGFGPGAGAGKGVGPAGGGSW